MKVEKKTLEAKTPYQIVNMIKRQTKPKIW